MTKIENFTKKNAKEVLDKAQNRAKTMIPDNSAPLMTHDIGKDGCNGLEDCPKCNQ